MTYIVRVDRGKSTYLYECRSHRPGPGMNPVSEKVYIGRVDRETRVFHPKRYHVTETLDMETLHVDIKELPKVPLCHIPMVRVRASSRVRE